MQTETIVALRAQVAALERGSGASPAVPRLPFDIPKLDAHLPGQGLALGAVHELFAGGPDKPPLSGPGEMLAQHGQGRLM